MKILESAKELKYYTEMNIIMNPFKNDFIKYNWLITDYECNYYPEEIIEFEKEYKEECIWTNGKKLYEIIETYEIEFIWAVFSGFKQNILFEKTMEYGLPKSEYYNHWKNKKDTQIPLADIEIVSWDSSCLLFSVCPQSRLLCGQTLHLLPLCAKTVRKMPISRKSVHNVSTLWTDTI